MIRQAKFHQTLNERSIGPDQMGPTLTLSGPVALRNKAPEGPNLKTHNLDPQVMQQKSVHPITQSKQWSPGSPDLKNFSILSGPFQQALI